MNKRTVDGFTRISKRAAEKRYNAGEVVILCPVKLRTGFPFFLKSRYNGKSFPRSAGMVLISLSPVPVILKRW